MVRVTNLDDAGEGSLRWALEDLDMPRIVVFDIGGTIALEDGIDVKGDVTVAGQTAPGEGITVTGGRLRVVESDVIIRGLKVRPGDGPGQDFDSRDGISVGKSGSVVERVIIDSNSLTQGVDENAATWGSPRDVTFSNNIIAEGLNQAGHSSGDHSMGLLIGSDTERTTIARNLFVSNEHRNPQVIDSREIEVVNNVVVNYGDNGFTGVGKSGQATTAHLIGNVFVAGRDTAPNDPIRLKGASEGTAYYLDDNLRMDGASGPARRTDISEGDGTAAIRSAGLFEGSGIDAMDATGTFDHVVERAGARPDDRDAVDARIVDGVLDGSSRIVRHPDDLPSHASPTVRATLRDTDADGIPDLYEAKVGSAVDVADAAGDADGDGYTNIEEYVNGLLDGFDAPPASPPPAPPAGPVTGPVTGKPSAPPASDKPTAPEPGPDPVETIRIQAEDAAGALNMEARSLGNAYGGSVMQVVDRQEESGLDFAFAGGDGLYDITVRYYDETDGESLLSLLVGGEVIDVWAWDAALGSEFAEARTATTRTIQSVALSEGDTIRLLGRADGREPLRIDMLELDHVGPQDPVQPPAQPPAGPPAPSPDGPPSQPVIHLEAEDADALTNMRVASHGAASGGRMLQAKEAGESAFSMTFDGVDGFYRIAVDHFDETDGESRMAVEVGGVEVDAWTWDATLGSEWAAASTRTTHETGLVKLVAGDTIRFAGEADANEPLRVDTIRLEWAAPAADPGPAPKPAPEAWRIEAEAIEDLANMRVDRNADASGGRLLRADGPGPSEASFDFGGRDGLYDVEIDFFDEADGASRLALEVDGRIVDDWVWNARATGDWANAGTLATHRIEDVALRAGSEVALVGEADGGEPLRIDAVAFLPDPDLMA